MSIERQKQKCNILLEIALLYTVSSGRLLSGAEAKSIRLNKTPAVYGTDPGKKESQATQAMQKVNLAKRGKKAACVLE